MDILWWHWLVLGLVLVVAEMAAAGGFYIIFFGIGALAVGVLAGLGFAGPVWMQILLFSAVSVSTLGLFRGRMLRAFQPDVQLPTIDALVGEVAIAAEDLPPGGVGRVELRGAAWSARNGADVAVARGARCRVTGVDGLTLYIVLEGAR
jgi:membrane protein implicated in regulation of membrane protease activity